MALPEIVRDEKLDALFEESSAPLGVDLDAYRNHTHRVFNFALALGVEGVVEREKLAVACYFHDLGIWTDKTFDYIEPSVVLATAELARVGSMDWEIDISSMIRDHHKVTRAGGEESLVEIFRQADWADVSLGLRRFGIPWSFVRMVQASFPNCGFHQRLVQLSLSRLWSHPLSPMPMFRW